ncbi:MAG: MOFRL family protein, partial [Clostridia bacterium]|nr:MOFRL family protein [Clostridia bacterium]
SDVLGDRLDIIASGPTTPDISRPGEARRIMEKFGIEPTPEMLRYLDEERPRVLDNVENHITGSVRQLCLSAEKTCKQLGYDTIVLTDRLCCTARDAGSLLGAMAMYHANDERPTAFIMGGETVVRLTGKGLGGRNQEIALASSIGLDGLDNACVFSVGSDGTDGPTDAAGGYCDGETVKKLARAGMDVEAVLDDNDSYHALKAIDGLIMTGPTGTNVNDLTVLLIRGKSESR